MRKLTYIGHSAFLIEKDWEGILIDPFITGNPLADFDYRKKRISHIVVTHAHLDHLGDAIAISKSTGAIIIAVLTAIAMIHGNQEVTIFGMNGK